jgi:LacI family transcriptional regulator
MQVRLVDIAAHAGVSVATVSHVLGGKRAERYTSETRARIEAAARTLGYRPNTSARAMRSGRSGAVTLLLPTEKSNFLPPLLLAGIHDALAEQGRHLIVARYPDARLTEATFLPRALKEWMSDGIIVNYIEQIPPAFAESLAQPGAPPTIWLNVDHPLDSVRPDDEQGGYELTRLLLERGHTRIAYVGLHSSHYSAAARQKGYKRALSEAGLPALPFLYDNPQEVFDNALALREKAGRPTALVAYESFVATPLLMAFARQGVRVPEDLSLVTFHNSPLEWELGVSVTMGLLPLYELGRVAAEQLARKLQGEREPLPGLLVPLPLHHGSTVAGL